jgi:hypothetical protein
MAGNAGWRHRRHHGRHADALARHGQDAPAGRPPHAAQVHVHGQHILHHLAPGRLPKGPVWRRPARLPRLLRRHRLLLRRIRVEQADHDRHGHCAVRVLLHGRYARHMLSTTSGSTDVPVGLFADLAAAPAYVPSEVLKTRLQLQGRHNNPYFNSGYNYRGTLDAARTIARVEGFSALFHGYKATLWRDLPFSALQFAFYEELRDRAKRYMGSNNIGLLLEIATAASAGGMAGVITTPLDVVKTRIQTQQNDTLPPSSSAPKASLSPAASSKHAIPTKTSKPLPSQSRPISTSSPSTTLKAHNAATLDTSSVMTGLKIIYKTEGVAGWFRGVGPRAVWTSVQSGTMLVLYQTLLRYFEQHPLSNTDDL